MARLGPGQKTVYDVVIIDTYGLRWDRFPVGTRQGRGMERYDFAMNQVILCGVAGNPTDCGHQVSNREFSPWIGIAFRPTDTFVIRAGFGINYDPQPFWKPGS